MNKKGPFTSSIGSPFSSNSDDEDDPLPNFKFPKKTQVLQYQVH